MNKIDINMFKEEIPEFKRVTKSFYNGEISLKEYKGFSGYYGSYGEKGGKSIMLRLRMTAGRIVKEKLKFLVDTIKDYSIDKVHFTTCQSVQLHNIKTLEVCEIMEKALDYGIVTFGSGGDYPRNVMCSPLSGLEEEYFDVMPWAEASSDYLMNFIKAPKMPRKFKVGFSNSPLNTTHATYRDLGFVAKPNGSFDVYSAGGLGKDPKLGVLVGENVLPEDIFIYIKAMWLTFRTYGNYEDRSKARTRYMQDSLGGAENYKKAFIQKLNEVIESKDFEKAEIKSYTLNKKGDGSTAFGDRIINQKQEGLYTVKWHPFGGQPDLDTLFKLNDFIQNLDAVEIRISPDETAYIVNLNGDEAKRVVEITENNSAATLFETSVSCIGSSVCQVGLRDSQKLLSDCIKAVKEAGIRDKALPKIYISGCPSSCGAHYTSEIGFRGGVKFVDKKSMSGFILYLHGESLQGKEKIGNEVGALLEEDIPKFLVELGKTVELSELTFKEWNNRYPNKLLELASKYI